MQWIRKVEIIVHIIKKIVIIIWGKDILRNDSFERQELLIKGINYTFKRLDLAGE